MLLKSRNFDTCGRTIYSLLVFLILTGAMGNQALAQSQKKERHTIRIFKVENTCTYEIADQEDQDLFRIVPDGFIDFVASGTNASISFLNDNGRAGTKGRATARIREDGQAQQFRVRSMRNESTFHKVSISCCTELQGNECSTGWEMARAVGDVIGGGEGGEPYDGFLINGPSLTDPVIPPVVETGGPVMKVDEDD